MLLVKAGFRVAGTWVDGLDWESADRYRSEAADLQTQRAFAREYDSDPRNWARRVAVAAEIIQAGLEAWGRKIE